VLERVLLDYRAMAAELPGPQARAQAAARLSELGWPTTRDEQWRYANLRAFDRIAGFGPAVPATAGIALSSLPPVLPGFTRLVYVDGRHVQGSENLPAGMVDCASAETVAPTASSRWNAEQRLGLLTEIFAVEPIRLHVHGEAAIELVLLAHAGVASYPKIDLRLAAGSRMRLIERHISAGARSDGAATAAAGLIASSVTVELARDAALTHYRLQQADARCVVSDTLSASLAEQSHYTVRCVAVGGGSARTSARVELAGRGAQLSWAGVAVGRDEQTHDTSLAVRHAAPGTNTEEIFRGIADDRARVAFSGHIRIDAAAAGAQTRQSLRGLIEGHAEIDLRPRLEILTDDVRAAHGATTGRLDEDLLFYLLARGIDRPAARALLKWAFLGDVLREIGEPPLRAEAERMAAGRLPDVPPLSLGAR
jgi:Fe-S cluster assembly protein SufD